MADRTRYLLAYDISHPRRLRRVHAVAKTFGYPLQYSLFICDLDGVGLIALKSALREEIHHAEDRISIFDLGPAGRRGVECVEHLGRAKNVPPTDAEAIW